jgi:hypothetical protein
MPEPEFRFQLPINPHYSIEVFQRTIFLWPGAGRLRPMLENGILIGASGEEETCQD